MFTRLAHVHANKFGARAHMATVAWLCTIAASLTYHQSSHRYRHLLIFYRHIGIVYRHIEYVYRRIVIGAWRDL